MRPSALLLAAGAGRRYGGPKALAHDGAWLRHGVEILAAAADDVVVVLGAAAEEARRHVPERARIVVAADWADGMGASLRAGLRELGDAPAVLVHLIDLPDVGSDVIVRVAAHTAPDVVARATYDGADGHPVLIGRDHWADLAADLRGDRGGRDWLALRTDVLRIECGDLARGSDVDSPAGGTG